MGHITEKGKKKETSEPVVAYQPSTTIVQEGAALEITPISNTSGKFVVLDVHSQVTELLASPPAARARAAEDGAAGGLAGPAEIIAALERQRLSIQQLATTLRVPVDEVMLIGGMTSDSPPDAERPNLFMFVKVTVQELRDDRESREMPAPKTEPTDDDAKAAADAPAADHPAQAVDAKGEKDPLPAKAQGGKAPAGSPF